METWKDVIGYEGYYQVSNFGNIKRIKSPNRPIEKIRKIQYKKNGYAVVMLSVKQKYKLAHVHRLVALSFIPNPENKAQINHKDLNKKNNMVENLEWVSNQENMNHVNKHKKWSNNAKSGVENARSRPVIQFDKNGLKIKDWINITQAAKNLQISGGEITMACQKKRKSAGGYQWIYADSNDTIGKLDYKRKSVNKISIDGNILQEYENVYMASKENKLSHAGIWNCCNGKYKTCGGFKWEYNK